MNRLVLCLTIFGTTVSAHCLAVPVVVKNISTGFNDAALVKLPKHAPDLDFLVA